MRFANIKAGGRRALCAVHGNGRLTGRFSGDPEHPGDLPDILANARLDDAHRGLLDGDEFEAGSFEWLPPISGRKIVCVGLNYLDHASETGHAKPTYPTVFARFSSSLIGHREAAVRPHASDQLDFEGEMVAVIGKGGRHIGIGEALEHVAGYSVFNDISVRDYQKRTTQWTMGKNFDGTGAFGPQFVSADELPRGGRGLKLETRLNGMVVQSASTDDMLFDVSELVSIISAAMTLAPGDVIVTGTPSGVGMARTPPLWMKPGDVCEVELEGVGLLENRVVDEIRS